MTDTTMDEAEAGPAKPSKLPLIIGVVLALAGGGGGFFAVSSGMLGLGGGEPAEHTEGAEGAGNSEQEAPGPMAPLGDIAFIEVPPMVISLGPGAQSSHLRFRASLEVPGSAQADVERILPRIQDVMNSYLRALEASDIEAPGSLIRIRAQLLRRIQLVSGEGRVRDLLVTEFVLN